MAELQGASLDRNGGFVAVQDLNGGRIPFNNVPVNIAVLGACERGPTTVPAVFNNATIQSAPSVFGRRGDMLEQIQEVQGKGLSSILGLRIGARGPFINDIGGELRIESVEGGKQWGTAFGIAYSTANGNLVIQDILSRQIVFDNNPSFPIDVGFFYIEGDAVIGDGSDIGDIGASVFVPMNGVEAIDSDTHFYEGHDGTSGLSRMELFEGVFKGLQTLENYRYRTFAAPERASLNAPVSSTNTSTGGTQYPVADSVHDRLGQVFIEELDGRYEFYWDVDGDGTAEFWSVNDTNSYGTASKGGIALGTGLFKTPNFAYMIAYEMDRMHQEVRYVDAVVAVEKPMVGRPFSEWHGRPPVYATDIEGDVSVSENGVGILGNKYIAGATNFRNGSAYGGFIRTTAPFFDDGTEISDANGVPVDMGRYLVLWATPEFFLGFNGVRLNRPYVKISPPAYAAWRESLSLAVTPTNQDYPNLGVLSNRIPRSVIDRFTEMRITLAKPTDAGTKILDGPVAALPFSDYSRQGTMRTIEFIDRALRQRAERYIGRYLDQQEEQALQQELTDVMNNLIEGRIIRAGVARYFTTRQSRIRGEGFVNVQIVVPFELRKVTFSLGLTQG